LCQVMRNHCLNEEGKPNHARKRKKKKPGKHTVRTVKSDTGGDKRLRKKKKTRSTNFAG